jgi:HPt (histidine-containing phosphotransfer) domain-containing protein
LLGRRVCFRVARGLFQHPGAKPGDLGFVGRRLGAGEDIGAGVLDPSIVGPLRTAKPEFWKRLVGIYMNAAPDNLKILDSALAAADCPTARMMAHTLKSSSANMGAMRLSDLCRQMEAAAAEEKLETSTALLTEIHREFDNVADALSRDGEPRPSAERSVS